ncbi:hypothetical protein Ddc_16222 [Ditylenchus destructor]|nr:hypothetical protein Ddc_16222 [Ditylenchus destructor]
MNFYTFATFLAVLYFSIDSVEPRRSHCEHGDPHHTPCIFDNHGPPCPNHYRCNSRNNVCCPKSQKRRNHERYPNHLTCFEDEAKHIINKHGHRIVPECDLDRRDRTLYCRPDKRSRSRRDKKKRKEYFCDLKHNWCCPDGKYLENIYESGRDHGRDTGDQDLVDDQLSSEEDLDRDGGGSGHHRGGKHRRNGGSGHGGSGHLRSGTHHQKGGRNGHRSRSGGQGRDRDDDDSDRQIDDDSLDVEHNGASGRGRKKGKHGKGRGKDRDRSQDQDQDGPLHDDQNDLESGEDGSRENSRNHKGGRGKGSHHNARGGQHQSQHNGNKRNGNKGDRQAKGRQGKGNVHKHPKGQNQAKKGPHNKKKPQG